MTRGPVTEKARQSSVPIVRTPRQVELAVAQARRDGRAVGLVPTMGFLHEGHLSLIEIARAGGADYIVVSIFVNPTQFGPSEDFAKYPRDETRDHMLLQSRGVDLLFSPDRETMYPPGNATRVTLDGAAEPLEGVRRPGHFAGVATIVLKLFNIVRPDLAVFGEKDAQQCAVIRRMVADLDVPVKLRFGPTQREPDGLALSSRNSYLSAEERKSAPRFHEALLEGRKGLIQGVRDLDGVEHRMRDALPENMRCDYLQVVDPETFLRPRDLDRDLLVVGAVHLGRTRLIDNIRVSREELLNQSSNKDLS